MERRLEVSEIRNELKKVSPGFEEGKFFDIVKINLNTIYNCAKNMMKEKNVAKNNEILLKKLLEENEKFKIHPKMDRISVQHVSLYDYKEEQKENNENKDIFVKVRATINFYDDVDDNNERFPIDESRCWNDMWIVTYKKVKNSEKMFNCNNCGAIMKISQKENLLRCDYCGNMRWFNEEWEIVDIDVKDVFGG